MTAREQKLQQEFMQCMDAVVPLKKGLANAERYKLPTIGQWAKRLSDAMKDCTKALRALESEKQSTMVSTLRTSLLRFSPTDKVMITVTDGHFLAVCRIVSIEAKVNPEESGFDVDIYAEVVK